MTSPWPPLMTTSEVATACSADPETVRRWVREGRIEAIILPGGHMRFRREDVERLLIPVKREPST